MNTITTRFQTELRTLLAERGTVDECAKAIGVNREAVSRWKSGKLLPGCENTLRIMEWMSLGAQSRILTPDGMDVSRTCCECHGTGGITRRVDSPHVGTYRIECPFCKDTGTDNAREAK